MGTIYKKFFGFENITDSFEIGDWEFFQNQKPQNWLLNLELIPISKVVKTAHHYTIKYGVPGVIGHPR